MDKEFATYVTKRVLAARLGVSVDTLKHWRLSGQWPEFVYWIRPSPRTILYNLELCAHWVATRGNLELEGLHQLKVQEYLQGLEVSPKRGRKTKPSSQENQKTPAA